MNHNQDRWQVVCLLSQEIRPAGPGLIADIATFSPGP